MTRVNRKAFQCIGHIGHNQPVDDIWGNSRHDPPTTWKPAPPSMHRAHRGQLTVDLMGK